MSIGFNPQNPNVKSSGREELAAAVGLSLRSLKSYFKKATHSTFLSHYNRFVSAYPTEAKAISDLRPDGVGPGELVAWFVFDNIQLGGRNSAIDLIVDGKGFAEMKGGTADVGNHALVGFKITKDADPAVDLLRKDLEEFNNTYRRITGSDLAEWTPGKVKTSTLRGWSQIDLKKSAKLYAGPVRTDQPAMFKINGELWAGDTRLGLWGDPRVNEFIAKFMQSDVQITVNNSTSTLQKIIKRWRQQAFLDYLQGKTFALVNGQTMQMVYFGELTVDMIGLYCIGRNQPYARIYLPKEKKI